MLTKISLKTRRFLPQKAQFFANLRKNKDVLTEIEPIYPGFLKKLAKTKEFLNKRPQTASQIPVSSASSRSSAVQHQ